MAPAITVSRVRHIQGMFDLDAGCLSELFPLVPDETIRSMTGVRMDAWLWAARFFKTRTLAKKACELGRVLSNAQVAKAAREVRIGDMLRITNDGGDFEVEVLGLSDVRGPASEAQKLYRETEASKELRAKVAAEKRAAREFEILPVARPSKRDRRRIIQFRERG
jgi:ribosome-associated heat shock protein Hsp15